MIYTVAAYSITFGVLGLYWVLLDHRRRESAELYARATGEALEEPGRGFNVGAALLAPIWMLFHGMRVPGLLLLLPVVALFPLIQREMWTAALFVSAVPAAAGAALGFVANRIGVSHTKLDSPAAWSRSQRPWALGAIGLYTIVLPWAWLWLRSGA